MHIPSLPARAYCLLIAAFVLTTAVSASTGIGKIEGRVHDEQGGGLGANILALQSQRGATANNEKGSFWLLNMPPGQDTLQITCLGFGMQIVPVRIIADSTVSVDIRLEEEPMWIMDDCYMHYNPDSTLPGHSTVIGYVYDGDNRKPLPGASVNLRADFLDSLGRGHSCCCYRAKTDWTGRFAVHDVAPGYRSMFASCQDYLDECLKITVTADTSLIANFELHRPKTQHVRPLMGRVWDAARRLPLAGVTVTVFSSGQSVLTDKEGTYRIENQPPGKQFVKFTLPGCAPQWRGPGEYCGPDDIIFHLASDSTRPPKILIPPAH